MNIMIISNIVQKIALLFGDNKIQMINMLKYVQLIKLVVNPLKVIQNKLITNVCLNAVILMIIINKVLPILIVLKDVIMVKQEVN